MTNEQQRGLLAAAWSVATDVSPAAFRKTTAYQHYVSRSKLRSLLLALDAVKLLPEFAEPVDDRLAAILHADGDRMARHIEEQS